MADIEYYGTGRRKTSTARVYLRPGDGSFLVNRKAFEAYFPNETHRMIIRQPLNLTETTGKFDVLVNVAGGGPSGQAGAIRQVCLREADFSSASFKPFGYLFLELRSRHIRTLSRTIRIRQHFSCKDFKSGAESRHGISNVGLFCDEGAAG